MPDYKIALLDMDGTFFDFFSCEKRAFFNATSEFGLSFNENDYLTYQRINQRMWKELEKGEITKERLRVERFVELLKKCNRKEKVDYIKLDEKYIYWVSQGGDLYTGAFELWKEISKKYRTCVLSNGIKWSQKSRLEKAGLLQYTDYFITSEEAGASKPQKEIFDYTVNQVGVSEKNKYIMIGDSYSADIKGSLDFGIDAIWYNPNFEKADGIEPRYTVGTYKEICDILKI